MAPELISASKHSRELSDHEGDDDDSNNQSLSRSSSLWTMQFDRHEYSFQECAQIDAYSFGVVLYTICCMRLPFIGMRPVDCYRFVTNGSRPSLTKLRAYGHEWGQAMADIISDCWSHVPTERPAIATVVRRINDLGHGLGLDTAVLHSSDSIPEQHTENSSLL